MAVASMAQQQNSTTHKPTTSMDENVSEIHSLTVRTQDLSRAVDHWNTAMICALVFAAFAAIAVVVTTWIVLTRAKQLADVEEKLSTSKEKQLALDLRDRDLKIAELGKKAADSETKAESFRLDIAKANESAAQARARAIEANLELEKLKAPRSLTGEQSARIANRLKEFAGQEFDVTPYWDSPESLKFANQIADSLIRAGWQYVKPVKSGFMLGGIVGVQVWRHPDADDSASRAADALVAVLTAEGFSATLRVQNAVNNPKNNKLRLNVGSKQ